MTEPTKRQPDESTDRAGSTEKHPGFKPDLDDDDEDFEDEDLEDEDEDAETRQSLGSREGTESEDRLDREDDDRQYRPRRTESGQPEIEPEQPPYTSP